MLEEGRYATQAPPRSAIDRRHAPRAGPKCPDCGWTTCRVLVKGVEARGIARARLLEEKSGTYARAGDFVDLAAEAVARDPEAAVRYLKMADTAAARLPPRDDSKRTYADLARLVSEAARQDRQRCDSIPLLRLKLALRARPEAAAELVRAAIDAAGAAVDIGDYVAAGADLACEALADAREAAPAGAKTRGPPALGRVVHDKVAAVAAAARDRRAPALYREALAACDASETLRLLTAAAEDGVPWGVREAAERLLAWDTAINLKAFRASAVTAMTAAALKGHVASTRALARVAAYYIALAPPPSRSSVTFATKIGNMSEAERWRLEDVAECVALVNRVTAGVPGAAD